MIFFDFTTSTAGAGMESKIIGILGDELLNEYETAKGGRGLFLLFYNVINDKPLILLQCSKKLNSRGINCAEIVRQLSPLIKGGGGGKPDFSQIGGFDPGMLSAAVDFIRDHIVKNIS
jgi:alanyl-tRNA synthetase